jgi:2-hydroxychromene-2-carboxylate isomerase
MSIAIDYYFSFQSPWAYIGHDALHDAMKRSGAKINYKPLAIGSVFEASDTPLLGKRHKTRQAYRTLELQRWAVKRGLEFNFWPAHWPFAAATGDKMIIAAVESGDDPSGFIRQVFTGIWVRETNCAEKKALVSAADAGGLDGAALLAQSASDEIAAIYDKNTTAAVEAGIFGVPAYLYKGEYFWGQDRIDLLEDAINSGRDGFKPVFPG